MPPHRLLAALVCLPMGIALTSCASSGIARDTIAAPHPPPPETAAPPLPASPPPPAPPRPPEPPPAPKPQEAKGSGGSVMNLTIGTLNVDGVTLKGFSCKREGPLDLLRVGLLAAGFVERKARLDACSKGKVSETTVSWIVAGRRMTRVTAEAPDALTARCVERALAGASAPMPGSCRATLVHGKEAER